MTQPKQSFEEKLARIDAIVKEIASDQTTLDRGIALFTEGRELIASCEAQLRGAQAQVDAASSASGATATSSGGDRDDGISF
ncbi:MAG TPA: exodeoxyribonuclease VII small subunit [Candidatus Dormibacteraeota bacterium]|nr:exodeoxyribonuclease VII small subunit [Candidatus Dormibacteraeota bacterium]